MEVVSNNALLPWLPLCLISVDPFGSSAADDQVLKGREAWGPHTRRPPCVGAFLCVFGDAYSTGTFASTVDVEAGVVPLCW